MSPRKDDMPDISTGIAFFDSTVLHRSRSMMGVREQSLSNPMLGLVFFLNAVRSGNGRYFPSIPPRVHCRRLGSRRPFADSTRPDV